MTKKGTRKNMKSRKRRSSRTAWIVAIAVIAAGVIFLSTMPEKASVATASPVEFTDVRSETARFIEYNNSLELTAEQEAIKKEALTRIPAPCCSDNTAYTCCCPCNMAKTWWGLSNHLIADEGYGADEVQAAVEKWIAYINPDGFSGKACYIGRCSKPFAKNGCGGMNETELIF